MAYPDDGPLTLQLDDVLISGWQTIRVTRGLERFPSSFDVSVTEKFPGNSTEVAIAPGQVCRVKIGNDLVLTGYVDAYTASIEPNGHTVRIVGRSACEDLTDCSVTYRHPVINRTTLLQIAQTLSADYGVTVSGLAGPGPTIPQIMINLGETPYQVIERVASYGGMLVYDDVSGNLVLNTVGKEKHSSGFKQAVNVLKASVQYEYFNRYTEYHAYLQSTDSFADLGQADQADGNTPEGGKVLDPGLQYLRRPDGQPRRRVLSIISEQPDLVSHTPYAVRRANWEMARRYGHSHALRVEVDSWRDSKGKLWEPNYLVPVDIAACKVTGVEWVIGEVSYIRDDQGTRAELVVMAPQAYDPEPTLINPFANPLFEGTTPPQQEAASSGVHDKT